MPAAWQGRGQPVGPGPGAPGRRRVAVAPSKCFISSPDNLQECQKTMTTKTALHRSLTAPQERIEWNESSPLTMNIETRRGTVETRQGRFVGGVSDGVEVIEVDTGSVRAMILPTRGMSIWRLQSNGIRFGWDSPVAGPVHPSAVPLFDPTGLGWLEGFDELVVRCGLESNGAPEHDLAGNLVYPLHGRIGNLAAQALSIDYDEASGRVEVIGQVVESRLFVKRLRLRSRIRFHAGSPNVELLDDVTNDLSKPASMQLLYHINVGTPVLGSGATLEAAIDQLAPKDALSASEIETWNHYQAPQDGFEERVYFARLRADDGHLTTVMLRSADGETGLGVTFNISGLPRFVLWKHTAAESDGYVTGLEPSTNYPNQRSYEQEQGRVVELAAGQTVSYRVTLQPLTSAEMVNAVAQRIRHLSGDQPAEVFKGPRPGWTPGA